jgi:hypothetical protein
MYAELPAPQVKPAAEIRVLIITAAEGSVEAADLKKNAAPHKEGMAPKAVRANVTAGLAYVPVQFIPGIIISGGNDDCKLWVSCKRFV